MVGIAYASYDAVNSHTMVEFQHVVAGVCQAMKITGASVSEGEIYSINSVPASIDLLHLSVT